MQPRNRSTDLSGNEQDENIRSSGSEGPEELENTSDELDDETTEPVLDEADLEENDLTDEDLDDIEWEEPTENR